MRKLWAVLGMNYELQNLFAEAIPIYQKAAELSDTPFGLGYLGHAFAKSGRGDEAEEVLERLLELRSTRYVHPNEMAYVYAGLGDLDRSFEGLDLAYEERIG